MFVDDEGNTIDLIHEYGQISMEILRQECQNMAGPVSESNTRMAKKKQAMQKNAWWRLSLRRKGRGCLLIVQTTSF